MMYITLNPDNTIATTINGDLHPLPPGGIILTAEQARRIARDPHGHVSFKWVGGDLVNNDAVLDAFALEKLRGQKIRATRDEGLRRIAAIIPALGNEQTINLVIDLAQAGAFVPGFPTPGSDIARCRAIYQYAKQRIDQAQGATLAQLQAYDPATDPGWPG